MKSFDKILPLLLCAFGLGACASGVSQAQTPPLPGAAAGGAGATASGAAGSAAEAVKPGSSNTPKSNHVAGELLVRFKDEIPEAELSVEKRKAHYLLDVDRKIYATEAERIGTGRLFRLVLPRDFDIARAMKILMNTKKFKYVEKNQKFHTMQGGAIGI